MNPFDPVCYLILSAGVFAGAVVSGLVGFAFSAVAGAILLHVLPPVEAVPLMMVCSLVPQAVSLVALRGTVKWRGNPVLIAGGALGILPALYLLHHIDARSFRIGFGLFLAAYATYMLFRPAIALMREAPGRLHDAAVGFGGGLIGGLTAMPGALPAISCDLRGMPKNQQRGQVQPFIIVMQVLRPDVDAVAQRPAGHAGRAPDLRSASASRRHGARHRAVRQAERCPVPPHRTRGAAGRRLHTGRVAVG